MNGARITKAVRCPVCGAAPSQPCTSADGTMHLARIDAYNARSTSPEPSNG